MTPAPQPQSQPAPPLPVFATVAEFCRISGMGRTSLYLAMRDGHIPARKIGARTVVSVAAGLAWIESLPVYRPATEADAKTRH